MIDVAKRHKLRPYIKADADFPLAQVMTPHALELGCDPDYNAWTMEKNPRPRPPRQMRTAAGHIHVAWRDPDDEQRWAFVRAMDVQLGLPSILVTPQNRRRSLYGRAGACRLKPYGVEYRTPDNFYLDSWEMSKKVGYTPWLAANRMSASPLYCEEINKFSDDIPGHQYARYAARDGVDGLFQDRAAVMEFVINPELRNMTREDLGQRVLSLLRMVHFLLALIRLLYKHPTFRYQELREHYP